MRSDIDQHREGFLKILYGCWSRRAVSLVLVPCLLLLASGGKGDLQATKAAHMQKGGTSVAQERYEEAVIELSFDVARWWF